MNDQEVEQKIVQLTEVLNNPSARRKINALSILHDIFYNTHESRDLSVENADVLNVRLRDGQLINTVIRICKLLS